MKIIRKFYDGMATDGSGGSIQEKKSDEYEQAIKRGGKIYADAYIEGFVDGYTDRHIEAWEHDNQLSAPLSEDSEWDTGMPLYDGDYLCSVIEIEDCGEKYTRLKVIECFFNNWVVKSNQTVTHWQTLPSPPKQ